ncbi:MAG: hypothetical protein QXN34_05575 [Archaeoglobaceae archaeon]
MQKDSEQVERRKKIKKEVEKKVEKLKDSNGITTIGTFKSDTKLQDFIRKKKKE